MGVMEVGRQGSWEIFELFGCPDVELSCYPVVLIKGKLFLCLASYSPRFRRFTSLISSEKSNSAFNRSSLASKFLRNFLLESELGFNGRWESSSWILDISATLDCVSGAKKAVFHFFQM